MRVKIFGTYITVTFLFSAFVAAMLIIDRTGLLLPLLFAIVSHEAGHLIAMHILNCRPSEIILKPASVEIVGFTPKCAAHDAIIAACGPAVNLFLFFVLYIIYKITGFPVFIEWSAVMLVVGLFNLIPAVGLDGGDLLFSFLCLFLGGDRSRFILKILSLFLAGCAVFFGVFIMFRGGGNPSAAIFGIYLFMCLMLKK